MLQPLKIEVHNVFLEEQSIPEENIYLWAYNIKLFNIFSSAIIIKGRTFEIIDVFGQKQIIEGVGLANIEPILTPNAIFEYASGVLLTAPSGVFTGIFDLQTKNGENYQQKLPSFSLDSKYDHLKIQ